MGEEEEKKEGAWCTTIIADCTYPICDTVFSRSKFKHFSLRNLKAQCNISPEEEKVICNEGCSLLSVPY